MIIATGSRGFVGSNLMNRLSEKHEVSGLDRGGIFNPQEGDIVFHCACDGDARGSNANIVNHTKDNIGIFTQILQTSIDRGVKRFVYISSAGVTWEKTVYAIEKLACEEILKLLSSIHGFEYVIVRPHNLFGEGMNLGDKSRNVIANFIKKTVNEEPLEIIGDPKTTRQFTYIGQLIDILEGCIDKHTNETLTVGSGVETSVEDLKYMITNLYKTMKWVDRGLENESDY